MCVVGKGGGLYFLMSSIMRCHYVILDSCFPGENKHARLPLTRRDWAVFQKSQKTHTFQRCTRSFLLTKNLFCYCGDPPVTGSGMIYSRQMQGVCDTLLSPEMLSVINELFGHQVQKSRRVSGSGSGLHYMQSSQRGSAWLPGAMGNIYRTDTLTTINDNWLSVSNGWSEKSTRWERTSQ